MFSTTLPLELLIEIFKYIENDDDYKTLYSFILVNKQWNNINVPKLWKNPFYNEKSTKILINCLYAEEDKELNSVELNFELLEKPLLHNYARFTTELDFWKIINNLNKLVDDYDSDEFDCFRKKLVYFILDSSTTIKKLDCTALTCQWLITINNRKLDTCEWLIDHDRFDTCFQNLYEFKCNYSSSPKLIDKLTKVCKNIQILKIHHKAFSYEYQPSISSSSSLSSTITFFSIGFSSNKNADYNLTQLIKAQNRIKQLDVDSLDNKSISEDLKKQFQIIRDNYTNTS